MDSYDSKAWEITQMLGFVTHATAKEALRQFNGNVEEAIN
jgi:hypothetical protein